MGCACDVCDEPWTIHRFIKSNDIGRKLYEQGRGCDCFCLLGRGFTFEEVFTDIRMITHRFGTKPVAYADEIMRQPGAKSFFAARYLPPVSNSAGRIDHRDRQGPAGRGHGGKHGSPAVKKQRRYSMILRWSSISVIYRERKHGTTDRARRSDPRAGIATSVL